MTRPSDQTAAKALLLCAYHLQDAAVATWSSTLEPAEVFWKNEIVEAASCYLSPAFQTPALKACCWQLRKLHQRHPRET